MSKAVLDSSIVIGVLFRHAGERASCIEAIPPGYKAVCSRYVIYEIARGFLRSLITLHNHSFDFTTFAALHQAAHSGQLRFKPYAMQSWLGAFDDYFALLDTEDGIAKDALKLEEFRAKLRGWIRRGWKNLNSQFESLNQVGCREVLPAPILRSDGRIDQNLPIRECGVTSACDLQSFLQTRIQHLAAINAALLSIPNPDKETSARIAALTHLQSKKKGEDFDGEKCFRCGDALICMEASKGQTVVTKNRKHFDPVAKALGISVRIAETAKL